ncbi:MAG TPA: hypothetical protein VFQ53_10225 [Kofleriaceae bacterium]|nr:hypothetical protein [Kofleriaceae bacterium]
MDRPRFRHEHLVAEPVDDSGARYVDVMDPDSGNYFRFYEVEFSLACAMDGERDAAGLVQWAKEELGLMPSLNEVRTVIATLGELGYLDQAGAAKAAASAAAPARKPAAQPAPTSAPAQAAARAAVAADDELARGVVVGAKPRPAASPSDVELGQAGTRPMPVHDMPKAPDLALGAPGTARTPAQAKSDNVPLGAPGRGEPAAPKAPAPDVSLDLTEQMPVRAADVKEAVRQSKVIQAVDVPKELLESPPAKQAPAKPPERPTPQPQSTPQPVAKAEPVVAKPTPVIADKAPVPPGPERRSSPIVVILLILVIGALATFLIWKYVLGKKQETPAQSSSVQPTEPVVPAKQPEPPPPPPAPAIKLVSETPKPIEVTAPAAGTVEAIETKPVKAGDVIARLAGYKPLQNEITTITRDIEKRVQPQVAQAEKALTTAQATNDATSIAKAQSALDNRKQSLEQKQQALATKQAELDKFLLKAPLDGEPKPVAKPNAKVAANDPIVTLAPAPMLVATFKAAGAPAANTAVYVAVKGSEKKLTCKVLEVGADGAKVGCPADPSLEGAEVELAGPVPADAPAEPPAKTDATPPTPPAPPTNKQPAKPPAKKPATPDKTDKTDKTDKPATPDKTDAKPDTKTDAPKADGSAS